MSRAALLPEAPRAICSPAFPSCETTCTWPLAPCPRPGAQHSPVSLTSSASIHTPHSSAFLPGGPAHGDPRYRLLRGSHRVPPKLIVEALTSSSSDGTYVETGPQIKTGRWGGNEFSVTGGLLRRGHWTHRPQGDLGTEETPGEGPVGRQPSGSQGERPPALRTRAGSWWLACLCLAASQSRQTSHRLERWWLPRTFSKPPSRWDPRVPLSLIR